MSMKGSSYKHELRDLWQTMEARAATGYNRKVFPRPKDTRHTHTDTQLHIGQLLLSFCHANGSTSEAETKDKPRYTSKIKNKQPSQAADKLTVLTCPFPLSTFHLQLVVRYKKTKSCQQQQQQQQKLPTGNWLTLKGSTSQVRKLLFVFCSSFLSLSLSRSLHLLLLVLALAIVELFVVTIIAVTIAVVPSPDPVAGLHSRRF